MPTFDHSNQRYHRLKFSPGGFLETGGGHITRPGHITHLSDNNNNDDDNNNNNDDDDNDNDDDDDNNNDNDDENDQNGNNSANFQARTSRFRMGVDLHNTYNKI